nr:MAG: hypothetical protein 1 [Hangzhou yanvirus-like virus 1]
MTSRGLRSKVAPKTGRASKALSQVSPAVKVQMGNNAQSVSSSSDIAVTLVTGPLPDLTQLYAGFQWLKEYAPLKILNPATGLTPARKELMEVANNRTCLVGAVAVVVKPKLRGALERLVELTVPGVGYNIADAIGLFTELVEEDLGLDLSIFSLNHHLDCVQCDFRGKELFGVLYMPPHVRGGVRRPAHWLPVDYSKDWAKIGQPLHFPGDLVKTMPALPIAAAAHISPKPKLVQVAEEEERLRLAMMEDQWSGMIAATVLTVTDMTQLVIDEERECFRLLLDRHRLGLRGPVVTFGHVESVCTPPIDVAEASDQLGMFTTRWRQVRADPHQANPHVRPTTSEPHGVMAKCLAGICSSMVLSGSEYTPDVVTRNSGRQQRMSLINLFQAHKLVLVPGMKIWPDDWIFVRQIGGGVVEFDDGEFNMEWVSHLECENCNMIPELSKVVEHEGTLYHMFSLRKAAQTFLSLPDVLGLTLRRVVFRNRVLKWPRICDLSMPDEDTRYRVLYQLFKEHVPPALVGVVNDIRNAEFAQGRTNLFESPGCAWSDLEAGSFSQPGFEVAQDLRLVYAGRGHEVPCPLPAFQGACSPRASWGCE